MAVREEEGDGGDGSESDGESLEDEDEDGEEEQSETIEERDEAKVEEEGTQKTVVKIGGTYKLRNKDDEREVRVKVLSRAGKARSVKWGRSYNVENLKTEERYWLNLDDWDLEEEKGEVECLLVDREVNEKERKDKEKAKEEELSSWEENGVFHEIDEREKGKMKVINTKWIMNKNIKEGREKGKARLVAKGFEEREIGCRMEAPTCSMEGLKLCLSVIKRDG